MKKIFLIVLILNFLSGCGSVKEGFKLKKGNTGDEFLVEKKNPLVLPPNFNELPEPGKSVKVEENTENESFKAKISTDGENKIVQTDESKSTEELILKNIKKNESN